MLWRMVHAIDVVLDIIDEEELNFQKVLDDIFLKFIKFWGIGSNPGKFDLINFR